uniref:Uncharacterized protein n=1 Tax=Globisporangium ultimum (strain ATCC 200006 / CBS 805.95 / DAOM BR144) TaxID=431595 RepID=K3WU33_GLOUD
MMQESLGGESSASAKRTLAKVQKMLQVASTKRNALALKDYREALEECLKTEASTTMKILGYRLASRCPSCSTFSTWQFLLDACVTELASSQNAPILLYALPLLQQIPLPLFLAFLISSEKEPMNKLRVVLTHEQSDVRCCAIATLSRVSLNVATSIAADGLFAFPFESHEARICCQQDLWIIVTDTWKVIFQALFFENEMRDVAGAAFSAMRMLFARGSMLNAFSLNKEPQLTQSAVNDVITSVFKEAFPRILSIQSAAKKLSLKHQADAITWVAMLLYMMMEKSGARCPGVSVSYLDIDVISDSNQTDDDDEDQTSSSTRRMRMDQLASDLLESWVCPLFSKKTSLAQSTALCRAMFLLLSHPLQEFTRLKRATLLVQQLIAQCYYHKSSDFKLEMSQMLVKTFAWVSPSECDQLFVRTVEAISLMERETDRQGLIQMLMDAIADRVVRKQEFLLLESLCAKDFFRQPSGSSVLAPRANGSQVFRCLVQALVLRTDPSAASCVQVAQLIVLKAFQKLLLAKSKPLGRSNALPQNNQLSYTALLSLHFQNLVHSQALLFRESLQFFQNDVQRAWPQITASDVRIQLLWVGIHLSSSYQVVPPQKLLEQIHLEIQELSASEHVSEMATVEPNETNTTFDDGKLGGLESGNFKEIKHKTSIESLVALQDCMALMARMHPSCVAALQQEHEQLKMHVASTASASSLQHHMMQEQLYSLSTATRGESLYSQEVFHPSHLFMPQKHQEIMSNEMHSSNSLLHADSFNDVEHEAVIVTGSADPLSLHVTYKQPLPGHEDVVAICVSCCNLTNVPLNDFEIHIRPLGAVKCIDGSNDLKLRLMQGGNASGSLPCFGVWKGEKQFQMQAFAQTSFFFQVVFNEVDSSADGDDQPQVIPIRLSPSEKFVLHFDALLRLPKRQFATGAFFQRTWQSAEASCRFSIESDLLIDTPIQTHIAFLTETRWEQFVAASVTLTASCGAPAEDSAMHARWSGVLEIRSSSTNIREFVKVPQDALHIFCGRQHLQIASDPSNRMLNADLHTEEALRTTSAGMQSVSESASDPCYTDAMLSPATAFPGMDFTTNTRVDRGLNKSDAAWTSPSFDNPFDAPEQLRPASSATFHDPWEM